MSGERDDILGRWSRRKQAARRLEAEEAAEAAGAEAASEKPDQQIAEPEPVEPREPVEPSPSLDDLTADGDLSAFLREGVPTALRNAAMRKMWSLDPAIRDHVGLSENAWDFNKPGSMRGFGPLEAGRAVVDFLSAVGREAIEDLEAAPTATEAPADASEEMASLSPEPEPEDVPEPPAAEAAAMPPSAETTASEDPRSDAPRPRHGGAMPR